VAEPTTPPEDVVVFNITAKNFFWNPPTIRVQQGDKVRLHLTSADIFHGFAIKEYDIDVPVQAGETETVEFVASKKGNFTFYCSVYCGSGHGRMKGVLVVE
jgi:cytochrome c oxidase subunit 2